MSQRLPSRPNLDHLKKQAKDVLRVSRHRSPRWRLADAQHALARGYGFRSWPDLKLHVESMRRHRGAAARKQEERTAADTGALLTAAAPGRPRRSSHPIVGTWAARPTMDPAGAERHGGNVVVEFELADDTAILTQIAADPAGRDLATKMAIRIDGLDHPVQFGNDLTLQAAWTDGRTLETIVKHGDQIVARGTYAVAADGQSLVVSTAERLVVFERV
jgi:hypothetical protein